MKFCPSKKIDAPVAASRSCSEPVTRLESVRFQASINERDRSSLSTPTSLPANVTDDRVPVPISVVGTVTAMRRDYSSRLAAALHDAQPEVRPHVYDTKAMFEETPLGQHTNDDPIVPHRFDVDALVTRHRSWCPVCKIESSYDDSTRCYIGQLKNHLEKGLKLRWNGPHQPTGRSNYKSARLYSGSIDNELHRMFTACPPQARLATPADGELLATPVGAAVRPKDIEKAKATNSPVRARMTFSADVVINTLVDDWPFKFPRAIDIISSFPKGAYIAKVDISRYFNQLAVAKVDEHRYVIEWRCNLQPDGSVVFGPQYPLRKIILSSVPFGLKIAPAYAGAVTSEIRQSLIAAGIPSHLVDVFLDDFMLVGTTKAECERYLQICLDVLSDLNVPVSPEKVDLPAQQQEILGITCDTVLQEVYLSEKKRKRLLKKISYVLAHPYDQVALRSLLGSLGWLSQILAEGRWFMQPIWDKFNRRSTEVTAPRRTLPSLLPRSAVSPHVQAPRVLTEHDEWRLMPQRLLQALRRARRFTSVRPVIDLFATAGNEQFSLFLDTSTSTFLRDIAGWACYANPPFELWSEFATFLLAAKERDSTTSCVFVMPQYAESNCQALMDASVSLLRIKRGDSAFTQYEKGSPLFATPANLRWDVDIRLLLPSEGLTPEGAALHRQHFPGLPISRRQPRREAAFRAALEWFSHALTDDRRHKSKYFLPGDQVRETHVFTDASGIDGWGGHTCGLQFGRRWHPHELHLDITTLELIAVVEALEFLSAHADLSGSVVVFHVDNVGVVFGINAGRSRHAGIHALLGRLLLLAESSSIFTVAQWVPRDSNTLADLLSHRFSSRETRGERLPGAALYGQSDPLRARA